MSVTNITSSVWELHSCCEIKRNTAVVPVTVATREQATATTTASMDEERASFTATMSFLNEFEAEASDASDVETEKQLSENQPTRLAKRKKPTAAMYTNQREEEDTVTSTSAPATIATMVKKTIPPKTKKEELDYLRSHLQELEEKLRLLKRTTATEDSCSGSGQQQRQQQQQQQCSGEWTLARVCAAPEAGAASERRPHNQSSQRMPSMWEELAMRQYQQRQSAEVENLKLKSMLDDQLKLAKGLQRMLKRSKCDQLMSPQNQKKSHLRRRKERTPQEEASVFHELSSLVVDMYNQVDAAFADAKFASSSTEDATTFRDVNVFQDPANGTTIQVLNAAKIPFDVHMTAQAIWDYFIHEAMDGQGFHVERDVELTNDSVMKSLRVELQVKRYFGRFHGQVVGRRFVEAHRVVIVWAVLIEPVEVSDSPMDGIIMRQQGWTVVRRPPNDSEGSATTNAPVALMQTKQIAIPTVYDDVFDHKRKLDLLTTYVATMLYSHIDSGQKLVENLLFQSLQQAKANKENTPVDTSNFHP